MAQDLRNDSATRAEDGRTPERRNPPIVFGCRDIETDRSETRQIESDRGGALNMACNDHPSTPKAGAPGTPVIEARGLRKAFGATVALDGVNLWVEEGRILGVIGPNGAGKTTMLNAILGLTPYQGELKVLGRDPWSEDRKSVV